MSLILSILLGVALFLSSFAIDAAHTRYIRAVQGRRRITGSNWSVVQWGAGIVGFVVAVKVSLWYLPLEGLGLWLGSFWAIGAAPRNTERRDEVKTEERRIGYV